MTAAEMRVFQRPGGLKMAIFERPEQPETIQVGMRLPVDMVANLDAVVRLWRLVEEAHGGNAKTIDRTYVVRRLLNVGIDAAFGEFGAKPGNAEEWKKLEALIVKKFGARPRY